MGSALVAIVSWTLPAAGLLAQDLGLRAAVVPGSTEVLVSDARSGSLVGFVIGQREGVFMLPGGIALGIVPEAVPQVDFADSQGNCYLVARFRAGSGAGAAFYVQALSMDPAGPSTIRVTPLRPLRIPEDGADANVIVLFGQSNAEGYADRHALPPGLSAPLPEARIWNEITGTWQPLTAGHNNTTLQQPGWCGPEMTLAEALTATGQVMHFVKFAVGQTPLGPNPGPWNEWGVDAHELHAELMRRFDNACLALQRTGMRPVVRGICMMQGENDALDASLAEGYQARLQQLVQRLRSDLVARNAAATATVPFVIGLIDRDLIATGFPFVDTVRAAQNAIAAALPQVRTVETTGLPLQRDRVHFDTAGVMSLGRSFAGGLAQLPLANLPETRPATPLVAADSAAAAPFRRGLHLAGFLLLLVGLSLRLTAPTDARRLKAWAAALHWVGFAMQLAAGLWTVAATNTPGRAGWPLWLFLWVSALLLLGALPWAVRRRMLPRAMAWLAMALLTAAAMWLWFAKLLGN